eukprot:5781817-Amphidinium_carterae.1
MRSGSNQDHIIHILTNFHMPTRTLQGAYQKGVQQIYSESTTWGKPTGALDGITHRPLDEDPSVPTVHVQSTIESIERKTSLYSKLLQLHQRNALIAFGTIKKDPCLVLPAGIPSLSLEGEVE